MTAIDTARLHLRPPRSDDAAALAALMTEDVSSWMASWPHPCSEDMARQRIADAEAAMREGRGAFCVMTQRDGTVMGWLGILLSRETPRTGSLTYWLGNAFHRRGYIGEALPPFLQAATAALRLDRLEAGAQPDNAASIAVLRRIGMTFVEERMDFVPARNREEPTAFYALSCS
ncbi:MAG TPA: GNAT family N-acetyltransferase [Ferrovibrio sp.]|jgi:ribosomal-protein-alanine N-acetyltransferase|uniref:GNAT family N-acetyltransferase n=1 Tax=Ferrovibrio sp. TaxID=1917215 RepID=UPI002B4B4E23|nr:GNAT family N-acetyltransferase [Ferrovibrio sp.]HLT77926.1 GNAT family N-acetyltransferase [Ferrovibrio sp.]